MLKLLVVEDNPSNLDLITEVLESLDAEVRPISESQHAAVLVNQEKFDGVFLDLEMPSLNGFQLARQVRQSSLNKTTPIVIITGRDERDTMSQAFATGANFFLQKPIDRQKLLRLFRTVRGSMVENRRQHIRIPLQTEITCHVESRSSRGRTWNLSQGGLQVEVENLKAGDSVRASWRLPGSLQPVDVLGRIVWASESRQGIQFTQLNRAAREEIRKFISQVENL